MVFWPPPRYQPSDHIECFHCLNTPSRRSTEAQEHVHSYIQRKSFCFLNRDSSCQAKIRFPNQLTNYMAQRPCDGSSR